jgi:hypothetical protein
MPLERRPLTETLARQARTVAAALLAAFWPGRETAGVGQWLETRSPRARAGVVAGVLAALLGASLAAAPFGPLGMLAFFVLVVALIR